MICSNPHSTFDVHLTPVPGSRRCRAMRLMSRWWDSRLLSFLPLLELAVLLALTLVICAGMIVA